MIAPPSMEFDLSIEDFREPNNPSIDRRFLRPSSSPFLSFPLTLLPFHRYPSFKRHLLSHPVVVPLLLLPLFLPYDSMFALLCRVSPRYSNLARHLLYFFLFFFSSFLFGWQYGFRSTPPSSWQIEEVWNFYFFAANLVFRLLAKWWKEKRWKYSICGIYIDWDKSLKDMKIGIRGAIENIVHFSFSRSVFNYYLRILATIWKEELTLVSHYYYYYFSPLLPPSHNLGFHKKKKKEKTRETISKPRRDRGKYQAVEGTFTLSLSIHDPFFFFFFLKVVVFLPVRFGV